MKRSKHNLSYSHLYTTDMGELVPIGCMEVLPGDTVQHATSILVRCTPLLAPVMHKCDVRIHHWFVPFRLVWEDWEKFITGGPDGMDASVYPTITTTYSAGPPPTGTGIIGGLLDYLGVPPEKAGLVVSALPVRAYNLIWNENYRDQDLQQPLPIDLTSGPDTTTNIGLQDCAWEKDYFTSSRPWAQKGPDVTVPLQGVAPIKGIGATNQGYSAGPTAVYESGGSGSVNYSAYKGIDGSNVAIEGTATSGGFPNIRADLSNVAIGLNDLRLAMAMQRWEEARARYGSRYTEYLRYLGVRSSDARLQRPEYLGGGKHPLQFSEVLQTTPAGGDPDDFGVGTMRGHGIGAVRSNRYRRFFEEHGVVISLASIRPRTMYPQGLHRMWSKTTKEDYWQKELQHIGQQEVYTREVYAIGSSGDTVFGYQDRYDEYRRMESRVSGEFRTSLYDYWHMARMFTTDPTLNNTFVSAIPTRRIFAAPGEAEFFDTMLCQARHSIQARRLVSARGNSFIY